MQIGISVRWRGLMGLFICGLLCDMCVPIQESDFVFLCNSEEWYQLCVCLWWTMSSRPADREKNTCQGCQIGPKWEQIRDFFRSQWAKIYWNQLWRNHGFVPFRANLTQFGPKSGHPDTLKCACCTKLMQITCCLMSVPYPTVIM